MAMIRPWWSMQSLSAIRFMLAISWVTTTLVRLKVLCRFRMSASMPAATIGSRPAEGSS